MAAWNFTGEVTLLVFVSQKKPGPVSSNSGEVSQDLHAMETEFPCGPADSFKLFSDEVYTYIYIYIWNKREIAGDNTCYFASVTRLTHKSTKPDQIDWCLKQVCGWQTHFQKIRVHLWSSKSDAIASYMKGIIINLDPDPSENWLGEMLFHGLMRAYSFNCMSNAFQYEVN